MVWYFFTKNKRVLISPLQIVETFFGIQTIRLTQPSFVMLLKLETLTWTNYNSKMSWSQSISQVAFDHTLHLSSAQIYALSANDGCFTIFYAPIMWLDSLTTVCLACISRKALDGRMRRISRMVNGPEW